MITELLVNQPPTQNDNFEISNLFYSQLYYPKHWLQIMYKSLLTTLNQAELKV